VKPEPRAASLFVSQPLHTLSRELLLSSTCLNQEFHKIPYRNETINQAPWRVEQKIRIGFMTECCWRIGKSWVSRVVAYWNSFCLGDRGTPITKRASLQGRYSSPNWKMRSSGNCKLLWQSPHLENFTNHISSTVGTYPICDVVNIGNCSRDHEESQWVVTCFHSWDNDFQGASPVFVQHVYLWKWFQVSS